MNPRFVALATVLDVVVLVGLGVGVFFAPLTLVWAFEDGFSTELLSSWAVAVQGWFLGHGVPLAVSLPLELSESLGLGVSGQNFRVDVALLGIALVTLLWGYRIGAREGTKKHPILTWFLAVGMMVGLSFLLVFFLPMGSVSIDLVDALVRPAVFLAAGLALATWAGPDTAGREIIRERFPQWLSAIVRTGFAAGNSCATGDGGCRRRCCVDSAGGVFCPGDFALRVFATWRLRDYRAVHRAASPLAHSGGVGVLLACGPWVYFGHGGCGLASGHVDGCAPSPTVGGDSSRRSSSGRPGGDRRADRGRVCDGPLVAISADGCEPGRFVGAARAPPLSNSPPPWQFLPLLFPRLSLLRGRSF
jgi:hypothetical protein